MLNKIKIKKLFNHFFVIALLFSFFELHSQNSIPFIVFGDWGEKNKIQTAVAYQISQWAQNNSAEFIISVGDNFYENGVESTSDPQWQNKFEDVYSEQSLQVPWYVALGNHDYHGSVQAEIDYSYISSRWKMPARYYTFSYQLNESTKALFVVMDTSPLALSDPESKIYPENVYKFNNKVQLQWLDSVLSNTDAKWKFVIGHHPVLSGGYHGGQLEMQEQVRPIMDKDGVNIYFCGHDHDMQHLKWKKTDKLNYFVSGAGSGPRNCDNTEFTLFHKGKTGGFLGAVLSPDEIKLTFIDADGNELYSTVISR
jgi:tartrate-resistant acid phosphatase type 5